MIEVIGTFDIELPSDCAEFNPWDASCLALGTYFLKDADTQTKEGAVELYRVCGHNGCDGVVRTGRFCTGAVFDLKWLARDTVVLARADGVVEARSTAPGAVPVCASPAACGPATYVDCGFADGDTAAATTLATAHATGRVALWDAALRPGAGPLQHWRAHDYEAWVAVHDRACPACVWSGGDDGALKLWDTRTAPRHSSDGDGSEGGDSDAAEVVLAPCARRRFDMGVTAVACHAARPLVAVGSYDESLTLWDVRSPRAPLQAAAAPRAATAGGGVWRLKWHRAHPDVLLAACMHVGYRVFVLHGGGDSSSDAPALTLAAEYRGAHTSLAYGADWMPPSAATDPDVLVAATCSFYDKKLSFWRMPLPSSSSSDDDDNKTPKVLVA